MDNQQILLRFGKSTVLLNESGVWIDGKHIGLQETEVEKDNFLAQGIKPYSHFFVLKDSEGNIHKKVPYKMTIGDKVIKGITDNDGKTQTIYSDNEKDIKVEIDLDEL
ncbi:hypothetical protein CVP05_12515 [Conservatibacter flavescens]|uniref:Uncharacterized protein n=2 Tax=Conservatibacter flavescens TaxID=28161 RepID=A0A2M8RZ89_9PAST|nr:hypothetical protein CVP05_12515 [Conservatibacter flavescens]